MTEKLKRAPLRFVTANEPTISPAEAGRREASERATLSWAAMVAREAFTASQRAASLLTAASNADREPQLRARSEAMQSLRAAHRALSDILMELGG